MKPKLLRQLNLTLNTQESEFLARLSDSAPGLSRHTLGRVALQVGLKVCARHPDVVQAQLRKWQQADDQPPPEQITTGEVRQ